jgi:hypothetical protein
VPSLKFDCVPIFIGTVPFIKGQIEELVAIPWVKHNLPRIVEIVDRWNDICRLQMTIQSLLTTRIFLGIRKAAQVKSIYSAPENLSITDGFEMRPLRTFEGVRVPSEGDCWFGNNVLQRKKKPIFPHSCVVHSRISLSRMDSSHFLFFLMLVFYLFKIGLKNIKVIDLIATLPSPSLISFGQSSSVALLLLY